MTPQEHYDEAERLLSDSILVGANQWGDPALHTALTTEALAHATLAVAGFTRDAATSLAIAQLRAAADTIRGQE